MDTNFQIIGIIMAEEEEWYDVFVRRPDDTAAHQRARELQLPAPTELFTSIYPQAGRDIKLVFKGYSKDSKEAIISSGLTQWDTSDVLCNYLLNDDDIKREYKRGVHLLELGSGLGKCGLLAHHLLQTKDTTLRHRTVLTDGDTNAMRLLQRNVVFNTDDEKISCQQLRWGEDEAKTFLSTQQNNKDFNLIIGSDLLQTTEYHRDPVFKRKIDELFETVKRLGTTFILAHNEERSIPVDSVIAAAARNYFFCEVLKQEGPVYLLRFRRTQTLRMNRVVGKLQATITELESKVRTLKLDKRYAEDKILKLDERCTILRDEEGISKITLLSFDEDNLAGILSFLEPKDFAQLASTCKRFGAKTHQIGDEDVSLMKKMAYKIYEGASPWEKEVLPTYQRGDSPFFLYNELNKLRKPLKFDRLFSTFIQHAESESVIKPKMSTAGYRNKDRTVG